MKKIIFSLLAISFILLSFTEKEETITPFKQSSIEKGKKLFTSKTCSACHQEQIKVVGPALKDIAAKYKANKANIVDFLQGKTKPIVVTDPGQTAIMQASLNITKPMKVDDLKAISDYIMSIN